MSFLFLPIFGEYYLKKFKERKFDYWFYKSSIELLSLIFGLLLAFAGLVKLYEYLFNLGISENILIQTDKIIGIIVTLFLVIYFVHKMFLLMIGSTKYYIESTNTQLGQKKVTILTIIIILILLVAPEAFFAEMYGFISAVFHDKDYTFIDLLYFSFTLHYSIPMDASLKVFELKSILNEDNLGRFIQFLHIASTKVIELTIFASIGNIIYKRFILNNEKPSKD
ncbi:hypothetical protein [Bacillus sp. ISL-45]|uniref:hypothetical protein n=1 Tax=Bacillus sp. ISL-45 TaxID=2819128 RepID=UPI001BEAA832|nr:hypothetical protein [Bacillus sp. ISL-45]